MSLAWARPRRYRGLPAPAKLNRFLHVLGRRPDGYHEIQSVFAPVDLADTIDLEDRTDARIVRTGDLTGPPAADLAVRAALTLQAYAAGRAAAAPVPGVTLHVTKRIPVGAGLGGGSSDAATTLIGLNRLWNLRLSRPELAVLARGLGADVPFFLGAGPAFVEGIGEQLTPVDLPPAGYLIVYPQVHVSTAEIFADAKLTRDTKRTTIAGFSAALALGAAFGANDLEAVVRIRYAAVDAAAQLLGQYGAARMSGSGSAVFCVFSGLEAARAALAPLRGCMPPGWSAWAVAGLAQLPLAPW